MGTVSGRCRSSGKAGAGCNGAKSSAHPFPAPSPLARKEGVEMGGGLGEEVCAQLPFRASLSFPFCPVG